SAAEARALAPPSGGLPRLTEWRRDRGIPRLVTQVAADSDQDLLVDLENALSAEAFLFSLRRGDGVLLRETFLPGPDSTARPESFAHEVVVPFVRRHERTPELPTTVRRESAADRRFVPGSEWLYVKLY